MGSRTLDCNQSGEVVHAGRKIVVGRQALEWTDDRRVILSSVLGAIGLAFLEWLWPNHRMSVIGRTASVLEVVVAAQAD
jgi:hypothetical protein